MIRQKEKEWVDLVQQENKKNKIKKFNLRAPTKTAIIYIKKPR
jgi:hypothetical protein